LFSKVAAIVDFPKNPFTISSNWKQRFKLHLQFHQIGNKDSNFYQKTHMQIANKVPRSKLFNGFNEKESRCID
jgi:hypothetical protein